MAAISSLGVGSGLDLGSLVTGLIEAERVPKATRLAVKEQNLTTELSAFGLLRSSLSQFQSSLSGLQSATAFNAKNISLSNDTLFSASAENFADPGSYSVEVTALARAQSLASDAATAFSTVDDVIGEGTMTIQFGTTSTGPYSFTPDAGQSAQVIEVSAANGNNTLSGLRDYINDNDFDVQASIVNDGSGYRMVLTSERTGAQNSMEITVSGDGDGNDNDNSGLSQLAFNAAAQSSLSQTVAAQDAALSINGLDITRDSNNVTGAINGVTLDLLKADVGNIVTVDISESRAEVSASINGFVEAYNQLVENIDSLTAFNPETGAGSILIGDFTVRSISSQIRNEIFGRVSGLDGNIKSLVDIGITTNSSGTLDVDNVKLAEALENHGSEVEALFSLQGTGSDPGVRYLASTAETKTGSYAIGVTSVLTQGTLAGSGTVNDLRVRANNDNLTLLVDGFSTGSITLTNATYASEGALAAEIESQINAAANLVANGVSVTVGYNALADRFEITSNSSGAGSSVQITAVDAQTFSRFGLDVDSGTDGTDFAGTIDGVAATVSGRTLTSQSGDSKGLSVEVVSGGAGSRGTVSLTRGIAGALDALLDGFLQADGTIASRESSINEGLDEIEDERFKLDDRIAALEARLIRQFSALDALVAQFNQTSSFLSQQLANLPKPNSTGGGNS
jgi:flagellar hook-associated protein 2